jgi:hypothetical protein
MFRAKKDTIQSPLGKSFPLDLISKIVASQLKILGSKKAKKMEKYKGQL